MLYNLTYGTVTYFLNLQNKVNYVWTDTLNSEAGTKISNLIWRINVCQMTCKPPICPAELVWYTRNAEHLSGKFPLWSRKLKLNYPVFLNYTHWVNSYLKLLPNNKVFFYYLVESNSVNYEGNFKITEVHNKWQISQTCLL